MLGSGIQGTARHGTCDDFSSAGDADSSDMRSRIPVRHIRRVLCVFPTYAPAFGTFSHAFKLTGAKAFMPPQGLLLIASYLPDRWEVRFVDENVRPATPRDFAWADVVLATGMHIQALQIHSICARARAAGRIAALGGPSVSADPDRLICSGR